MLKAIETVYKGYRFRSRLEARWAVFFDTLGVPFEYEHEGYDLDGLWYLPDFWLPEQRYWIEIKPTTLTNIEMEKARRLAASSDEWQVFIFDGDPYWRGARCAFHKEVLDWALELNALSGEDIWGCYEYDDTELRPDFYPQATPFWSVGQSGQVSLSGAMEAADFRINDLDFWHPRIVQAYQAARQARFGR